MCFKYVTGTRSLQKSLPSLLANQRIHCMPEILSIVHYSKKSDGDKMPEKKKDAGDKVKPGSVGPPKIELKILPVAYQIVDFDERNIKMGRILSPHLSIYKKQLTSVLSILLRISGFILGVGIYTIGLSGLIFDMDINALADRCEKCDCSKNVLKVLKFFIILPFAYHMVAGTRHLIWYLNVFLTKPHIYATGYAAIALSLILAAGLAGINIQYQKKPESSN